MAAESGALITWEQALASNLELAPGIENFTFESEAPVKPDAQGRTPSPCPASPRPCSGGEFVVRASARIWPAGYGLKAALANSRFTWLERYDSPILPVSLPSGSQAIQTT